MRESGAPEAEHFDAPTVLPSSGAQAEQWQAANRSWWERHSMRYDWDAPIGYPEFSPEFYAEIDRRFFESAREYLPWKDLPFEALIDFPALGQKDVLEIGVGNGSHAQLLARHARSFHGIDLTEYAVKSTRRRMEILGLDAQIQRMDAERMEFPDASFDFVWSWGVIHHSSNTPSILQEIHRVLRPGGSCVTMVYHRGWWNYYVVQGLAHGLLSGTLLRGGSIHDAVQSRTDGAIARFYFPGEWRELVSRWFVVDQVQVYGQKIGIVPMPPGRLRRRIAHAIPDALGRLLTHGFRMGAFLVCRFHKPA
jgi:SAM-dependent methyltransferase